MQTCLYNKLAYIVGNQTKLKSRKVLMMPYLHERRIYLNRRHTANQFYTLCKHTCGVTLILCICVQDNKMYIYTETGILVERVSYQNIAQKYGKPVEISENGLILTFQKSNESTELHLIQIHIDKLEWVATIDLKKSMDNYFRQNLNKISNESMSKMKKFYERHLGNLDNMKNVGLTICLNDDAEIMVRLKPIIPVKKENALEKALKSKIFASMPEFENQ